MAVKTRLDILPDNTGFHILGKFLGDEEGPRSTADCRQFLIFVEHLLFADRIGISALETGAIAGKTAELVEEVHSVLTTCGSEEGLLRQIVFDEEDCRDACDYGRSAATRDLESGGVAEAVLKNLTDTWSDSGTKPLFASNPSFYDWVAAPWDEDPSARRQEAEEALGALEGQGAMEYLVKSGRVLYENTRGLFQSLGCDHTSHGRQQGRVRETSVRDRIGRINAVVSALLRMRINEGLAGIARRRDKDGAATWDYAPAVARAQLSERHRMWTVSALEEELREVLCEFTPTERRDFLEEAVAGTHYPFPMFAYKMVLDADTVDARELLEHVVRCRENSPEVRDMRELLRVLRGKEGDEGQRKSAQEEIAGIANSVARSLGLRPGVVSTATVIAAVFGAAFAGLEVAHRLGWGQLDAGTFEALRQALALGGALGVGVEGIELVKGMKERGIEELAARLKAVRGAGGTLRWRGQKRYMSGIIRDFGGRDSMLPLVLPRVEQLR